jgi:hypothetical protein
MHRPLPPFRVKPLRTVVVRKTVNAERIREIAAELQNDSAPAASPLRVAKPGDSSRLKVLGRT